MTEKTVRQRGLYFEEFEADTVYRHEPGRTVTEADNTFFTTMTMNPASIHLDAHTSADNEFGVRIVNSMFTLSTLVGLSVGQTTQGTTVANLGFEKVEFPNPVFVGDTLFASTRLLDKRLSKSRPNVGIVRLEHVAHNQKGDVVALAWRFAMMRTRPSEETS